MSKIFFVCAMLSVLLVSGSFVSGQDRDRENPQDSLMKKYMPDLVITECKSSEENPFQLKVTVKNNGGMSAASCYLRVEDTTDKDNIKTKEVPFTSLMPKIENAPSDLSKFNTRTVIITCPFRVYGGRIIRTTIDSNKTVRESNERNNTCTFDTMDKKKEG
jgi:hypothetical protein